MEREYHKWYSHRLQRDMELLIFGHGGRAVLFFPTRMGRFYEYENWRVIDAVSDKINNGELQLFCVDSIDHESYYNDGAHPAARISRYIQYEEYILNEVLPLMQVKNRGLYREVAGCSMGAYYAVNLAMKHPHLFNKVVGMSGRYDLTYPLLNFKSLLDDYHNQDIYFNMPLQYLANLTEGPQLHALRRMEVILVIGETDPFLENNRQLSHQLLQKVVSHQLYVWDGEAHKARYWRQMVQLYL